jgi:hypothetical protein
MRTTNATATATAMTAMPYCATIPRGAEIKSTALAANDRVCGMISAIEKPVIVRINASLSLWMKPWSPPLRDSP